MVLTDAISYFSLDANGHGLVVGGGEDKDGSSCPLGLEGYDPVREKGRDPFACAVVLSATNRGSLTAIRMGPSRGDISDHGFESSFGDSPAAGLAERRLARVRAAWGKPVLSEHRLAICAISPAPSSRLGTESRVPFASVGAGNATPMDASSLHGHRWSELRLALEFRALRQRDGPHSRCGMWPVPPALSPSGLGCCTRATQTSVRAALAVVIAGRTSGLADARGRTGVGITPSRAALRCGRRIALRAWSVTA